MNETFLKVLPIFTVLILFGMPSMVLAQEATSPEEVALPDELLFLKPIQDGLSEVTVSIAENAVNVISALIILGIGYLAGKGVYKVIVLLIDNLVKIAQKKIKIAGRENAGQLIVGDVSEDFTSPRNLVPLTVKWFVYIIFIIASVNALGFAELSDALTSLWVWIPRIIASVVTLVLGMILVRFTILWILGRKIAGEEDSESFKTASTAIKVVLYSIILAIAITLLGVGEDIIPTLVQAFAYALAGAFILGVGLGMRDVIPKWIAGKDNEKMGVKKGNQIEIQDEAGTKGTVAYVGVTKVKITLSGGKSILIPHSDVNIVQITEPAKSDK